MKRLLIALLLVGTTVAQAQVRTGEIWQIAERHCANVRTPWKLPQIEGYKTLVCDFHMHTVFSDGKVWPDMRVDEAWAQGLDAITITDHLEYQPNKDILKGDMNTSYQIAKKRGDQVGMIVIPGAEITRNKPLGHLNAIFVKDANPLQTPDELEAIELAYKQGAFIEWNHPGWPDNLSTMYDVHKKLLSEGKIHGIEIFNGYEYYPPVAGWCREYKVAYMGNSDIHASTAIYYGGDPHNRPVTLVFAREKSAESIREALFAKRTVALFNNMVVGPEEYLRAMATAALNFTLISTDAKGKRTFEVENTSEIEVRLRLDDGAEIPVSGGTIRRIVLGAEQNKALVVNFFSTVDMPLEVVIPFVK